MFEKVIASRTTGLLPVYIYIELDMIYIYSVVGGQA